LPNKRKLKDERDNVPLNSAPPDGVAARLGAVCLEHSRPVGEMYLPTRCNATSALTTEVKPEGSTVDFTLDDTE